VAITVLLVDDDPIFRGLARAMLPARTVVVIAEAATVAAALAAARVLRPDSALVDVELPDGNGVTLAGALTGLPRPPRIILTSTDADAVMGDDVSRCGAAGFVPKSDLPSIGLEGLLAGP
jgi:DNA-binding NarL/FixJ family response regulator